MRLEFNGQSGIVTNRMGMNLRDEDVFVFVNVASNRMKILHCEEGGLALCSLRIEMGRMCMPFYGESNGIAGHWDMNPISPPQNPQWKAHMSKGQTVFTEGGL